jgi:hypothetical protein
MPNELCVHQHWNNANYDTTGKYRQLQEIAGASLLVLQQLEDKHTEELACAALGAGALGEQLRQVICSTCQGNIVLLYQCVSSQASILHKLC